MDSQTLTAQALGTLAATLDAATYALTTARMSHTADESGPMAAMVSAYFRTLDVALDFEGTASVSRAGNRAALRRAAEAMLRADDAHRDATGERISR